MAKQHPPIHDNADDDAFIALVLCYLENRVDEQGVDRLNQLLDQSPHRAAMFRDLCYHGCLLQDHLFDRLALSDEQNDLRAVDGEVVMEMVDQNLAAQAIRDEQRVQDQQHEQAEQQARRQRWRNLIGDNEPVQPIKHYVIPKPVFYGAIATVAAMLLLLILSMFETRPVATAPTNGPALAPEPQFVQVAVLAEQVDAHWLVPGNIPGSHPPAPGDAVLNQKMHLTSGLAKIRFNNEAEVILEAPCSIEPISDGEIKITHGKLVGRCETVASRGFVVQTPGARIVDLGTEFGVKVDRSGVSDAHVFEGEIKLAAASTNDQPVYLFQGQSRQVDTAGTRVSTIETDESDFVRGEEFEANAKADQSPYHRWLAHSYKLRRDPNLVAYYPFDNQSESPGQLFNRATATQGQLHGRLESQTGETRGPQWTAGRFGWPKQAMRFDAESREQARVGHHPVLDFENAVSFAMWVRTRNPRLDNHLLTKRVTPPNGQPNADAVNLVWVGDWPEGSAQNDYSILFHTHYTDQWGNYETSSLLKNQTGWVHLAVTYDQNERVYYLNGERVGAIPDNTPIEHNTAPLLIGGVAYAPTHRHFGGVMDELAIFNKALDAQDIREMYEAGKP